jgi:hypothetical protein
MTQGLICDCFVPRSDGSRSFGGCVISLGAPTVLKIETVVLKFATTVLKIAPAVLKVAPAVLKVR